MKHNLLILLFALSMLGCGGDDPVKPTTPTTPDPEFEVLPHTKWSPSQENPVVGLNPGANAWDHEYVNSPMVLLFKDTLRMWYEGSSSNQFSGVINIGYAWSETGSLWHRRDSEVFAAGSGAWGDYPHMASPSVLVDGDTLRMWYGGGTYTAQGLNIGYAVSTDGIHWDAYKSAVIIATKSWNEFGVMPGPVLKEDGVYKMWLAGGLDPIAYPTVNTKWSTGYATSTDGIHWTVRDEPVLKHGLESTDFDFNAAVAGTVLKTETGYEMYYSGSIKRIDTGLSNASIGYATSTDGIVWNKYEGNPILTNSKASDALYNPRVLEHGGKRKMWYSVWHPGPTIHYAIATN